MASPQNTILIVEDEPSILKGIAETFAIHGYKVIKAKDGREGLALALAEHPDFMIVDYRMPNMDGLTMLGELRHDAWGNKVKVMVWSNSHSAQMIQAAKVLGVVDVLLKSEFEFKDVVRKVSAELERPAVH